MLHCILSKIGYTFCGSFLFVNAILIEDLPTGCATRCKQTSDKGNTSVPRVINVDKNAASPQAIADLKGSGMIPEAVELRQVKYLNTLIEQDHRFLKRLVKPGMGFFSFETARQTLQGYEA